MKFTTSLLAAATAALAAAAPTASNSSNVFSIVSVRSASPIHYYRLSVYDGGLAIGPKQNSSCTVEGTNYASFFKSDDGGLYLYTDFPTKQAYVDLSEEGAGRLRFSTGVQPIDPKYKRGPFEFIQGKLFFRDGDRDIGFQACPLHDGEGYSVLLQPFEELAGPSCLSFSAFVSEENPPIKCLYNDA
ncbi:hypothetical protein yc1106_06213 [Curvularia clavata]|uniref:Cell wall protein PhiA n=1 Tax=Curvularia clavata TaxID=95742 RepID=A0A9Q9DUM7_CURCL|nr:hypothetical protein yc1106_06213 [Curvularia clavata]